jgi:hypothetical protein
MASYLILGAGKFGRLALQRLSLQDAAATFWVVDRDPGALAAARGDQDRGWQGVVQDAISFLKQQSPAEVPWDWLIPVVPVHVAFAYLTADPQIGREWEIAAVPEAVGAGVQTVRRGPQGELYLSRAGHRCPDDCRAEPVCPVSGESRERPLYEELAALKVPGFEMQVLVSRQLAPGVGGYPPRQLWSLAQDLAGCRTGALIATACDCHGVVHGLRRRSGR